MNFTSTVSSHIFIAVLVEVYKTKLSFMALYILKYHRTAALYFFLYTHMCIKYCSIVSLFYIIFCRVILDEKKIVITLWRSIWVRPFRVRPLDLIFKREFPLMLTIFF